jgi:hypothetical protein
MTGAIWVEVIVGGVGGGGTGRSEEGSQRRRGREGGRRPIIERRCEEVGWLMERRW